MGIQRRVSVVSGFALAVLTACGSQELPTVSARRTADADIPVFVIGDASPHGVGATVTFWGAQWWKENTMSGTVSDGVASFKGYASQADASCGGTWSSWPGNSSNPPAEIAEEVMVIVTSQVVKNGAVITGDIQEIVMVSHDGNYRSNPGHAGMGTVTSQVCGGGAGVIF